MSSALRALFIKVQQLCDHNDSLLEDTASSHSLVSQEHWRKAQCTSVACLEHGSFPPNPSLARVDKHSRSHISFPTLSS